MKEQITLSELGLNSWTDFQRHFFHSHALEVAAAIAHWVHTPDCSPVARDVIRAAIELNGSTKSLERLLPFECSTCCDSGRISIGGKWASCPECSKAQ